MNIDDLFEGEIRTSSMMGAVNGALNHNIESCNFCVKQAFSWQGTSNVSDRIETLKRISEKIFEIDKIAAHILTAAIINEKRIVKNH